MRARFNLGKWEPITVILLSNRIIIIIFYYLYIVITRWRHTLHILLNMSSVMDWDGLHWYCRVKWVIPILPWTVEITCYHPCPALKQTKQTWVSTITAAEKQLKMDIFNHALPEMPWINSEKLLMRGKVKRRKKSREAGATEQEIERTNICLFQYLVLQYLNQYIVNLLGVFTSHFSYGSKVHSRSVPSPSIPSWWGCFRLCMLDFDWGSQDALHWC